MTVIDASALVAYVLREERWEHIEEVLREAPVSVELLPLEAANAVLMARRTKRLTAAEANRTLMHVHGLCEAVVTLLPHVPLLPAAWEMAENQGVTIYDAAYIALARRERVALATRDGAQAQAARGLGIRVAEV